MVGVVSRTDILHALLIAARGVTGSAPDDGTIRDRIPDTLAKELWASRTTLNVTVLNGVVDLWAPSAMIRSAARSA
jgi:hypothetical protein